MRNAPLLLAWTEVGAPTPRDPLRFLEPPGLALLRQNISWLRTEINPPAHQIERIVAASPRALFALFDPGRLGAGLTGSRALADRGLKPVAVRGRWVPQDRLDDFSEVSLADSLLPLLVSLGEPVPQKWVHPVVLTEAYHPRYSGVRYGTLFTCLPEPGLTRIDDVGRSGRREGAPTTTLDQQLDLSDVPALLDEFTQSNAPMTLVVDCGGDSDALAALLLKRKRLGAWFAQARRPVPRPVVESRIPVYTWFEPEDLANSGGMRERHVTAGLAFLPFGLVGQDLATAEQSVADVRRLGYGVVVPRFFVPEPNTNEWLHMESTYALRVRDLRHLDGGHLVFECMNGPWDSNATASWTAANRWPEPARTAFGLSPRTVSFRNLSDTINGYLSDVRVSVPTCHARDLLTELLGTAGGELHGVEESPEYPFVSFDGRNPLLLIREAIELRLRSLADVPPLVCRAIQHASLVGGKRIRPILVLVMSCAQGVPLDAALPAALATEWIHTASLIQDDLPCMDGDDIRRRDISTHRRYGEGLALLASDALIAMAFEDLASLRTHPQVGADRVARMLHELATTIGPTGLVGGQARDLLTRQQSEISIQEILDVHRRKTVPLFRLTAALSIILADIGQPTAARLLKMLEDMGLAFQIIDDILDATDNNEQFGRDAGSDQRNNLPTFHSLMGTRSGRRYADQLLQPYMQLSDELSGFSAVARIARFILQRRH